MKKYKPFIIMVDEELVNLLIAKDRNKHFTENQTEDDKGYYFHHIDKEDGVLHDGKIVYGKGLIVLDPDESLRQAREIMHSGDLTCDFGTGVIYKKNKELDLSYIQLILLEMLMCNYKRILSRNQLITTLEGISKVEITDNALCAHVSRLRKVLGTYRNQSYIKTHSSKGYAWNMRVY